MWSISTETLHRTDEHVREKFNGSIGWLVYLYIRDKCKEEGHVRESQQQMADNILETFWDDIPSRKVRKKKKDERGKLIKENGQFVYETDSEGNFIYEYEKTLSDVSILRAIEVLKKDGIITEAPSTSKAEPNMYYFHGLPDHEAQVNDILSMIKHLNQHGDRFEASLKQKDIEIEQLRRELEEWKSKAEQLQEISDLLGHGKIVGKAVLQSGAIAVIIENETGEQDTDETYSEQGSENV